MWLWKLDHSRQLFGESRMNLHLSYITVWQDEISMWNCKSYFNSIAKKYYKDHLNVTRIEKGITITGSWVQT